MELSCSVQNYHWGKSANESSVAELAALNDPSKGQLDESKRYAEFWMGTHPNGPSTIKATGQLLADFLKENPQAVAASGDRSNLPYLFKVLSVDTALSIQAHPNKGHAEQLHSQRPDLYKDDNHKPEMAVAVTKFEGLCGFRPLAEIQHNLKVKCPELAELIGAEALIKASEDDYSAALREAFTTLMTMDKAKVGATLDRIKARIGDKKDDEDYELCLRLMDQYPGDVGCLVMFFLNHVRLEPGEAMFLGANVPHAYLSGDCMECMSRSDNVVRAGLTPKVIDVDTLVQMLDYACVSDVKFKPETETEYSVVFDPPVPDFSVAKIELDVEKEVVDLVTRQTGSILIVTSGSGTFEFDGEADKPLAKGTVLFIPANKSVKISNSKGLIAFQAFF